MIYPLLPVFVAGTLGAGAISLGVIEGLAESTAAICKLGAGVLSDRVGRRKPLLYLGYGLAGAVRPLIGLARSWPVVLAIRLADRVGKGLRGAPRDALIADVTEPALRGTAFGVHRAADHAGAVLGPLVAFGLLEGLGLGLRDVFLLAAVPAALVMVILAAAVREPARAVAAARPAPFDPRRDWRGLGPELRRLLGAVGLFTLGNSTDAFLLLRLATAGIAPAHLVLLWSAHHVVKVLATYAGGRLADHLPRRGLIRAGWLLYAAVYLAFAVVDSPAALIAVFLAYGVYFGLTEPVEKAWIAELAPADLRGTAFGGYHAVIGVAALPASLLGGALWAVAGPAAAFAAGAVLALGAVAILPGARTTGRESHSAR